MLFVYLFIIIIFFFQASRVYFGDNNVDAMFAILSPLHEMIEAGATTLQEVQFAQAFGADLAEAWVWKKDGDFFFFFFFFFFF